MKILMVATCVLVFCFPSPQVWAQNCKPDVSGQDKISKQQVDYWYKTVSTSGVAITFQVSNGPTSSNRLIGGSMVGRDGTIWEKQAEPQKPATQLTIEQIIQMVAAKLPDDVIIATIRKSGSKFDLTPDALIKLKTAGVSDAVLRVMMQ